MEMAAPFEVMGQGSYGCVVKPALTNVVDGSPKNYPGNVSKIFYDEEAAKEALVKANFWYRTFGEKEHKMSDYVQKYSYATLPGEIKAKCAGLGSDRPIYVTRMPNLGVSINELARHPDLIAQIRRVPFERILQQIDKLFNQIKVIYEKGYVHGDIRSPNVVVDPATGVFTIIDFDIFEPVDVFFNIYNEHLGYYSNPPESLLNIKILKWLENPCKNGNLTEKLLKRN